MELRTRPKDNFLETADWEHLYILCNHWKSELSFYRDELRFLRQLVNRYFKGLVDHKNVDKVQAIASRILNLSSRRQSLSEQVARHQEQIIQLIEKQEESGLQEKNYDFREDHISLEDDINLFVKDLKNLKKEVFSLTEHLIEGNRLKRLLAF